MEFGPDRIDSPRGAQFLPFISPSDPVDIGKSFSREICQEFEDYLQTPEGQSKKILTQSRRANFRYWLQNPEAKSQLPTLKERLHEANEKHHCLKHFMLDNGQVYHMPGIEKGHDHGYRYCVCTWDAAEVIALVHIKLHHASKSDVILIYSANDNVEVDK